MLNTIVKNKKKLIIALIAVVLVIFLGGSRSAEDTAKKFVESSFEGDAKKVVSLMSDITIEESPYQTKKLLIHATEKVLESRRERYKDTYGKKWKYKVKVIDSYDADLSDIEDYVEINDYIYDNIKDVVISVEHKGSGWFNDKEGSENFTVRCVKQGRKWYVLYDD